MVQSVIQASAARTEVANQALLDPVHKFRVSNPENLIDTDFEYGLQTTRWETLELVNNIPTFFARNNDETLTVTAINTFAGSYNVSVTTATDHQLSVGTPVIVQGVDSFSAEGGFVVSKVPSTTTFVYKANAIQIYTKNIFDSYSTYVFIAKFYQGSAYSLDALGGITTDGAFPNSRIIVDTLYPHGFDTNTAFVMARSVGTKTLSFDAAAVDPRNVLNDTRSVNTQLSLGLSNAFINRAIIPYDWQGNPTKFVDLSSVSSDGVFTLDGHGLAAGAVVVYVPPIGDTPLGGLASYNSYEVSNVATNTFKLTNMGTPPIAGSGGSTTTYVNYGNQQAGQYANPTFLIWTGSVANVSAINLVSGGWAGNSYYTDWYNYSYSGSSSYNQTVTLRVTINGTEYNVLSDTRNTYWTFYSYWIPSTVNLPVTGTITQISVQHISQSGHGTRIGQWYGNNYGSIPLYFSSPTIAEFPGGAGTATAVTTVGATENYGKHAFIVGHKVVGSGASSLVVLGKNETSSALTALYNNTPSFVFTNESNLSGYVDLSTGFTGFTNNGGFSTQGYLNVGQGLVSWYTQGTTSTGARCIESNFTVTGDLEYRVSFYAFTSFTNYYSLAVFPSANYWNPSASNPGRIAAYVYAANTSGSLYLNGESINSNISWTTAVTQGWYTLRLRHRPSEGNTYATVYLGQDTITGTVVAHTQIAQSFGSIYAAPPAQNQTLTITVVNDGSGNVFVVNGTNKPTINFVRGSVITFKQSSATNINHPIAFKDGNGNAYTTGVVSTGTPGTAGAQTVFTVASNAPSDLRYYCTVHGDVMGNTVVVTGGYTLNSAYKIGFGASNPNNQQAGSAVLYKLRSSQCGLGRSLNNYDSAAYVAHTGSASALATLAGAPTVTKQISTQFMTPDIETTKLVVVPGTFIAEQNSVYSAGHALGTNASIIFPPATGGAILPSPVSANAQYYAEIVDANRFRIRSTSGGDTVNLTSTGSGTIAYTTTLVNPNRDTVFSPGHNLVTGTSVVYNNNGTTSLPGLINGVNYYINNASEERFGLSSTYPTISAVDFATAGAGIQYFTINEIGASDGSYYVSSIPSATTLVLDAPFQIPKKIFKFIPVSTMNIANDTFTIVDHRMPPGAPVQYSCGLDIEIGGLSNNAQYYAIRIDPHTVALALTAADARLGQNRVNLTSTPNNAIQHSLTTSSIGGEVLGSNVSVTNGSTTVTADTTTKFTNTFKVGDFLKIVTAGSVISKKIIDILSDTKLVVDSPYVATAANVAHILSTGFYVKSDGLALHRPYDGGVELIGSTNSSSQIMRQTRKYFRYQSGKGIQLSLAVNFSAPTAIMTMTRVGNVATITTRRPHRLTPGLEIAIEGASDNAWNGPFIVSTLLGNTIFTVVLRAGDMPITTTAGGVPSFYVRAWQNSRLRCGLFDEQNGIFFEYDGQDLMCCRRSSVDQLQGTMNVTFNSPIVYGSNTNFTTQLAVGNKIVIKGQSYKVVNISTNQLLYIQPVYRGKSQTNVITTLTVDTRVKQSDWSVDPCDGTGPTGYVLNINRIQMTYIDYSWYGAGKVRMGMKDGKGQIRYMHHFVHNNEFTEAYLRSGNLPCRYEIENTSFPTYVPSLLHWGTSVIMDGSFDDDRAYLFTAAGKVLTYTNGDSTSFQASSNPLGAYNQLYYVYYAVTQSYELAYRIQATTYTVVQNIRAGTLIVNATYIQPGTVLYATERRGSVAYMYINRPPTSTFSNITFTAGEEGASLPGSIPLISIRLAPSVDNSRPGLLGDREILNRMQMILKTIGALVTHDTEIRLILNGSIDNKSWDRSTPPSLAQLVAHDKSDAVIGGTQIFNFRVQGGDRDSSGVKTAASESFELEDLVTLGNSILGGDGVFPDGPDLLTIVAAPIDTTGINSTSPYTVTARVTWKESQA